MVERQTGFLIAEALDDCKRRAEAVTRGLMPFKGQIHTITSDNGSEFAYHKKISKALNVKFYFVHPYSSWERGLNEYSNKLIR